MDTVGPDEEIDIVRRTVGQKNTDSIVDRFERVNRGTKPNFGAPCNLTTRMLAILSCSAGPTRAFSKARPMPPRACDKAAVGAALVCNA
jgi:hypothetical protein